MTTPETPSGQAPPPVIPVVAPRFHLRLRLATEREDEDLDLGGEARPMHFGGKAYRLTWGAAVIDGAVDADGWVDQPALDGTVERGVLALGERGASGFDASFAIPIVRVHPEASANPWREALHELSYRLANLGFVDAHPASEADLARGLAALFFRYSLAGNFTEDPFPLLASEGLGGFLLEDVQRWVEIVRERASL